MPYFCLLLESLKIVSCIIHRSTTGIWCILFAFIISRSPCPRTRAYTVFIFLVVSVSFISIRKLRNNITPRNLFRFVILRKRRIIPLNNHPELVNLLNLLLFSSSLSLIFEKKNAYSYLRTPPLVHFSGPILSVSLSVRAILHTWLAHDPGILITFSWHEHIHQVSNKIRASLPYLNFNKDLLLLVQVVRDAIPGSDELRNVLLVAGTRR